MAYSDSDLQTNFASEAGDPGSIATAAQIRLWFNEGQARLLRFQPKHTDITWVKGDRSIPVPSDFIQLDRMTWNESVRPQAWVVFGRELILHDPDGATDDGSGRLYYYADWPAVSATQASLLSSIGDIACLYYALHRFYRLLASNRSYYKRYATMTGANAVTVSELQAEADRYYQDFLDSRADLEPLPAAAFYGS